jgi:hypothetical protein
MTTTATLRPSSGDGLLVSHLFRTRENGNLSCHIPRQGNLNVPVPFVFGIIISIIVLIIIIIIIIIIISLERWLALA